MFKSVVGATVPGGYTCSYTSREISGDLAGQGRLLTARIQYRDVSGVEPDIILLETGPQTTCYEVLYNRQQDGINISLSC
ncbi:hypothetical protein TNCV_126631 [Trichonephila clavipes]|nr:hypothetical protein TNCV_126631 [Trichonephila clavipes]